MTQQLPASSKEVAPRISNTPPVRPHELECQIQRQLKSQSGLKFAWLTVHKCPQGVCLEGMLESNENNVDLCDLVNEIAGIEAINHVVTCTSATR